MARLVGTVQDLEAAAAKVHASLQRLEKILFPIPTPSTPSPAPTPIQTPSSDLDPAATAATVDAPSPRLALDEIFQDLEFLRRRIARAHHLDVPARPIVFQVAAVQHGSSSSRGERAEEENEDEEDTEEDTEMSIEGPRAAGTPTAAPSADSSVFILTSPETRIPLGITLRKSAGSRADRSRSKSEAKADAEPEHTKPEPQQPQPPQSQSKVDQPDAEEPEPEVEQPESKPPQPQPPQPPQPEVEEPQQPEPQQPEPPQRQPEADEPEAEHPAPQAEHPAPEAEHHEPQPPQPQQPEVEQPQPQQPQKQQHEPQPQLPQQQQQPQPKGKQPESPGAQLVDAFVTKARLVKFLEGVALWREHMANPNNESSEPATGVWSRRAAVYFRRSNAFLSKGRLYKLKGWLFAIKVHRIIEEEMARKGYVRAVKGILDPILVELGETGTAVSRSRLQEWLKQPRRMDKVLGELTGLLPFLALDDGGWHWLNDRAPKEEKELGRFRLLLEADERVVAMARAGQTFLDSLETEGPLPVPERAAPAAPYTPRVRTGAAANWFDEDSLVSWLLGPDTPEPAKPRTLGEPGVDLSALGRMSLESILGLFGR
ncbi:hypothetical protein QBC39DRAFT_376995 [Podospora conica]|nr:hypothetical protein QBC39DRAFT_376995 [Schizothecium conicum]